MNISGLSEMQMDALRELGGIGAGHAATALSQLVDRAITIEVPTIEIVRIAEVPHIFGGPEQLVGAVYARMTGDVPGGVLFVAKRDAALSLVDLMHGREVGTSKALGHEEEALLRHTAMILVSAYLAAIARMADLDLLPSSPSLAFDMAGALLEAVVAETSASADEAVFVRTSFLDEGRAVEAALFFLPDPASLSVILGRLGLT